jgi:cytochrome c oxidase subunit 2
MKRFLPGSLSLAIPAIALLMSVTPSSAHPSLDIVASNWAFTPSTITLYVGEPRELRLTSSAGVHGIESKQLGIPPTTIVPGRWTSVNVTPEKAGTYVLHCAVLCGAGHQKMTLTVKVVP